MEVTPSIKVETHVIVTMMAILSMFMLMAMMIGLVTNTMMVTIGILLTAVMMRVLTNAMRMMIMITRLC